MAADLMDPSPSPPQPPRTHARHPQPSPSLCDLDRPCSPPPASTSLEIEASPPSNHGCLAHRRARRSINLAGPDARVACLGSPATRTGQCHRLPRLRRLPPGPATGNGRFSQFLGRAGARSALAVWQLRVTMVQGRWHGGRYLCGEKQPPADHQERQQA
uniref:Uncharacterized protein n=1 Tax=Triticum urartu TaxID=4572 RepID=A0A8R7JZ50_TRIUA